MEREKIIFGEPPFVVEFRNGAQVCVFKTETGGEVLFSRDKNDNVIKKFDGDLDSVDFTRARGLAGLALATKLTRNGPQSTSKVIASPSPRLPLSRSRPPRLSIKDAAAHAQRNLVGWDNDNW